MIGFFAVLKNGDEKRFSKLKEAIEFTKEKKLHLIIQRNVHKDGSTHFIKKYRVINGHIISRSGL